MGIPNYDYVWCAIKFGHHVPSSSSGARVLVVAQGETPGRPRISRNRLIVRGAGAIVRPSGSRPTLLLPESAWAQALAFLVARSGL